jgi:hypothetical protein
MQGCELLRHGSGHDQWTNRKVHAVASVPRHAEVKWPTVRAICGTLGIAIPPGR